MNHPDSLLSVEIAGVHRPKGTRGSPRAPKTQSGSEFLGQGIHSYKNCNACGGGAIDSQLASPPKTGVQPSKATRYAQMGGSLYASISRGKIAPMRLPLVGEALRGKYILT